jgi:hypothetical protein
MTGRHFGYFIGGSGRSSDYRADVGFTRRTNNNSVEFFTRYASEPKPKAKLISWRLHQFTGFDYDWQGRMQGWVTEPQFRVQLVHQTFIAVGVTGRFERLFEEEFGPKRSETQQGAFFGPDPERSTYRKEVFAYGGTSPSKKYSAFLFGVYRWGEFDFDFGAGPRFPRVSPAALVDPDAPLDPGPGKSVNIEASFTYQPVDAFRTSVNYNKSRLRRYDTGFVAFDENIISSRATYQFTRFVFARARVDYATLASSLRGQFLFGWTPNPGTSFYVGYNDDLTHNGFNPFTGQLEPGFRRNGRTFFIKTSYLIRRTM